MKLTNVVQEDETLKIWKKENLAENCLVEVLEELCLARTLR
jgi:hypothetical protein